ncbi:heparanase-like [Physella acuta]|uniref:heparanase-like n=1 Tax=Physella acuta TaxID=109671 RepID=UPI0027DBF431|nr:heparanase-like [Physella acuta]
MSQRKLPSWCMFFLIARLFCVLQVKCSEDVDVSIKQLHQDVVELIVNLTFSEYSCDEKFLSVTIDSGEIMADWKGFDFTSKKLQNMAMALSPANVRLGGTSADFLTFDPDGPDSQSKWGKNYVQNKYDSGLFDKSWSKDRKNFTMSGREWENMTQFFDLVGWDIIFDFNLFKWKDGLWDPSNAETLLQYSAARGIRLPCFQLGNEPNAFEHNFNFSISPLVLLSDFRILKMLLARYPLYRYSAIYGPDVTNLAHHASSMQYFQEFIEAGAYTVINEASFHHYYMDGSKAQVFDFLDEDIMDSLVTGFEIAQSIMVLSPRPLPIRLTETSSCYGGGAPGLSDRYVAGFLWLDKLGLSALHGITQVARQTFYGGSYSLISSKLDPNPDFYLSVLYKRLVQGPVFAISNTPEKLRAYAHCASNKHYPAGALVIYFLNLLPSPVTLKLTQFKDLDLDLYLLTPGDEEGLKSSSVQLNGQVLQMSGPDLPPLEPRTVTGDVTVEKHSFGFIVVPKADVQKCVDYFLSHGENGRSL